VRGLQVAGDRVRVVAEASLVKHPEVPNSTLERDLMKDSLAIIKAFRQHLRLHYRLDFL